MSPWQNLDRLVLALILALAIACQPAAQYNGEVVEGDHEPLALTGTNWDGKTFELSDLEGRVTVVFFGYTYCPDICPFTLAKLKRVYKDLGDSADEVAVVFASVDPKRDSLEKLANYVPNFDKRFYGVRLELDELDAAKDEFGVTVQYGQPEDGPGTDSYYYVDHTGTYFILDRTLRPRVTFPPNATAEQMLPDIQTLLTL